MIFLVALKERLTLRFLHLPLLGKLLKDVLSMRIMVSVWEKTKHRRQPLATDRLKKNPRVLLPDVDILICIKVNF